MQAGGRRCAAVRAAVPFLTAFLFGACLLRIGSISGGNDKQGFPMQQGILVNNRVRLLMSKGTRACCAVAWFAPVAHGPISMASIA